jgi:hypothetical protein
LSSTRLARRAKQLEPITPTAGKPDKAEATLSPNVSFGHFTDAWKGHDDRLKRLIEEHRIRSICEVGGGANPQLSIDYIRANGLDCTILDVAQAELDKAPPEYRKVRTDICSDVSHLGQFDLVFTKMLAEHVADGATFHRNVHQILLPGGIAFHFFPTLFAPPFVLNWMLPEWISEQVLQTFAPRDKVKHGKFPARYSWCRGPSTRQIQRLADVGFEIVEYRGFFGHGYYKNIPGLRNASAAVTRRLLEHPIPDLTTFAYLIVRKAR